MRERFLPQGFNLFEMNADPCAGPVANGRTAEGRSFEECARSGVTAAQFGNIENSPAAQYNFLQGGNPNLAPEESDTYSFGLVWTPGFLDGLDFSFDYYFHQDQQGHQHPDPGVHSQRVSGRQRLAVRQGPTRRER